jgi:hypothetical protein
MFTYRQPGNDGATSSVRVHPLSGPVWSIGGRLISWAKTCAKYYAAATLYEHLSSLSDAELHRRGLSRATLAQHVRLACDNR